MTTTNDPNGMTEHEAFTELPFDSGDLTLADINNPPLWALIERCAGRLTEEQVRDIFDVLARTFDERKEARK